MKKCSECDRRVRARGLCITHYSQAWRAGSLAPLPTEAERFWGGVEKTETCWLWTRAISTGYGSAHIAGRNMPAHRYAYETLVGPIPDGLVLDHLCRVRNCVNPEHLEPVTLAENSLRGMAPAIIAWRTDTCPRGHEFSTANTYVSPNGRRACKTCRRDSRKRRYYANRPAA